MNDAIVIGAGPAGTACAKKLAENGFSVKVFDKRAEIGSPKRCGEGLSEASQQFTGKIPDRCIAQKIRGARLYAPNGRYLDAILDQGGLVLERKVFDKWLAEEAVKAGAEVQASTFISEIVKDTRGYFAGVKGEFLGNEFKEEAKVIVCATGAESPLRNKALGVFSKVNLIDSCIQYEMTNIDVVPDFIHIYLSSILAPRGYVWVFPKGENRANVGLGIIPQDKKPSAYMEQFLKTHPEISQGSILEVNAGCVPVGGMVKDMVANGLVLCGEAANHVNPIHGGGIKEAVISGQIAADVITECLKKNDLSKSALAKFNDVWWKERGNHLKRVEKLRETLERLSDSDLNDLVDALKPEDIIDFARGSKLSILAKVMMRKPKLIGIARHLL
ncbi:MAG: NAD(P)/FAD-dependent oxidoreductase [Candidatus Bathyarchaeota archaeon]|nr:NAD(P)/FAD-dependent oxidoreductase [Candidatus Bathyarchaeota archaeon]